jgi:cytochrome P450
MQRNLETLSGPIRRMAIDAADGLADRDEFDFIADLSSQVTPRILFLMLGLPPGNDREVRDKAVLMVQSDPVSRHKGPEHIAAYEWMMDYAAGVIAERRARPGSDLISQFVFAEIDSQRLEEREVLLTTTTLIMAGIESLGGFLAMFALNLADVPDARRALLAERALIPDAIEESLRYNTSAQRFRRRLTVDMEMHGRTMRAGDYVCLAYGSANRDERKFPDPDVYDIRRRPRGHLGFGGGVHACLGAMVARMAVRILFEEWLPRIPEFTRVERELSWVPSTTFRSPIRLRLSRR